MKIDISSISPTKNGDGSISGIDIYFSGGFGNFSININGYIPLVVGEFESFLNLGELESIVKQEVIERIMNGELDPVDPEEDLDEDGEDEGETDPETDPEPEE